MALRFPASTRPLAILVVATLATMATPLLAQDKGLDWPQFRGPGGRGVSPDRGLPTKWSDTDGIAWKVAIPGPGTSSPVIVNDRIFLTYYTGFNVPGQKNDGMDKLKLHLTCLERATGKTLWTREIAPKLPEQDNIRDGHGYASSTPAADAERVVVFFGKTGVFAFDHDGKQLWQADVGSRLNGWGSAASPLLHGDLVIINASVESDSVVALDKKTGKEVWRAPGVKEAWNTPLVHAGPDGKAELVVPILGKVLGIDPANGKQLWSCNTDIAWYMVPSPLAEGGIIYCIGGRSGGALAIRGGGSGEVTKTHRLWTGKKGSNVSSPILHEGHLYFMHEALGIAYCVEAKTGKLVYEQRVDRASQVYASPVLADGKLYYLSRTGQAIVIAAQPEYALLAVNQFADRSMFNASPAIAGGRLYIRSDRFLYCIGQK